jgi:AbrB family looped-hinge helix DNA binding protein
MHEATSTVTSKGQVTIPAEIRRYLGIEPADKVAFVIDGAGKVEIRPAKYTIETIRGIVPALPDREAGDFRAQIEEATEEATEHLRPDTDAP